VSAEAIPHKASIENNTQTLHPDAVRYRLLIITPKRDFGDGFLIKGKMVKEGWVVTDGFCNVMPGACWFQTIDEAKRAIDVLIAVKGDSDMFWEIIQPFQLTPGDKDHSENGTVISGRHYAIIKNYTVIEVGIRGPQALREQALA
jgi:hypothetical protein